MPLWLLLIPYAIFLTVFAIFSLVDILNAWRFRSGMISASFLILTYMAGTIIILGASYYFGSGIDWTENIISGFSSPLKL